MMSPEERADLFSHVDLRRLTGKPVPQRANASVRVDCPVHGGKNDLAIFRDHGFCFSATCGWSGGAFDTAAILMGLYSKTDVLWTSKHYHTIIAKLKQLREGFVEPEQEQVQAPTAAELEDKWVRAVNNTSIVDLSRIDRWRGWPDGTSLKYKLALTGAAIMIPVFDSKEVLRTLRYRVRPKLESDDRPKYWGTAGANEESVLYGGLTMPKNTGKVVVLVEGEFDTISSQLARVPTLNFINGAGWKDGRRGAVERLLKRFETIVVAYDQDEGGWNGVTGYTTQRGNRVPGLVDVVPAERLKAAMWDPRKGKDPNEYITKNGEASWRDLILNTYRSSQSM